MTSRAWKGRINNALMDQGQGIWDLLFKMAPTSSTLCRLAAPSDLALLESKNECVVVKNIN